MTEQENEILEILRRHGDQMWLSELIEIYPNTRFFTMKRLQDQGHIIVNPGLHAFHAHVLINAHKVRVEISDHITKPAH